MTRRKILEKFSVEEWDRVKAQVSKAIGVNEDRVLLSQREIYGLMHIEIADEGAGRRTLTATEIGALARAGIHPGAGGWEIEEAPVPRALPAGVAWYQHGVNEWRLEAGRLVLATARFWLRGAEWQIGEWSFDASDGWTNAPTLDAAKAAAETACRSNGLFAAFDAPPEQPRPTGDAARTLRRLFSRAAREDEYGPIASPAGETPEQRAALRGRLVDAFLAELGAEIEQRVLDHARESKPARLSFDERFELITYLEGNEREWSGRDAVRYAIGLLGERKTEIDDLEAALSATREEAATSDANAAELAGKLDAAQKRIAELGGEIDALQVALEASRGARTEEAVLRASAQRVAAERKAELAAIRSKLAEIINAVSTRIGGAS